MEDTEVIVVVDSDDSEIMPSLEQQKQSSPEKKPGELEKMDTEEFLNIKSEAT